MSAALIELPRRQVVVGEEVVDVRVRASSVARTIRVRVGPEHPLEVIVPAGTTEECIDDVLSRRAGWIARKLEASRTVADRVPALGLDRADVVWLDGKPVPSELAGGRQSRARRLGQSVRVEGPRNEVGEAIARWYRREARRRLVEIVEQEATRLGLSYASVTVRDQRTRWASCSPARNLAFNWRLVMAPEDVQRYVVVHELCHLRIANHSKGFWRMLDDALTNWRAPAAWLREHGHELRAYSVPSRE
jgi:predicted metal-dependent hydrolase